MVLLIKLIINWIKNDKRFKNAETDEIISAIQNIQNNAETVKYCVNNKDDGKLFTNYNGFKPGGLIELLLALMFYIGGSIYFIFLALFGWLLL